MKKLILAFVYLWVIQLMSAQVFIPASNTWKFLDGGSNQQTAWQSLSYNVNHDSQAAFTVTGSADHNSYEYSVSSSVLNTGLNAQEVNQKSTSSSHASFGLNSKHNVTDYFRKYPYVLYTGKNDEMMVIWQLNSTKTCEFSYGTDTTYSTGTYSTSEYGNDHQHKIVLTGLTPGQKYYYKVNVANSSVKKGSFNAGPVDTVQNITFFAYGDTRSNPDDHDKVAERVMQDITQHNLAQTFIINSGDLVSDGDDENAWDTEFFNKQYTHITSMLANLPYLAALGNHEGQGHLFGKYFPYPMFQDNRYYYSFDYGPVHVIVIDQETNYSQGSTEYNWIVNDLSSSNKPWKIAVFHKPGWSAGGHHNSSTVQSTLQPLFKQYNVRLAINGHNHYYSHAVVDGVHHITTGGGGAPLYNPNSSYPNIVKVDKSNHYCKIEVTGNTLHFYAIRANGTKIEDFTISAQTTGISNDFPNKKWFTYSKNGQIIVKTAVEKPAIVEIYDTSGRKIAKQDNVKNTAVFDVNKTGVYLVRFIIDGKFSVRKIIVNNEK